MPLDKNFIWRKIHRRLREGATVRTWSERKGHGSAFRIDAVTTSGVLISLASTGSQRRVTQKVFDNIVDGLNAEPAPSISSTSNASYALGILKHVGAF